MNAEVKMLNVWRTSKGNRGLVTTMNNNVTEDRVTVIVYKAVRVIAGHRADTEA